ncbi:hypothetical protein [Brevibacterium linens]|uniref:hypothetical protein n=1 Tax=Brevibacterium linens TaxID=1703 RepID=UPI0013793A76|nr:hypothetical protein [Brevibacterium linens]
MTETDIATLLEVLEQKGELTSVARFQLATLQYGLDSRFAALTWPDEHLPDR